jgi:hypothetical protein
MENIDDYTVINQKYYGWSNWDTIVIVAWCDGGKTQEICLENRWPISDLNNITTEYKAV